MSLLPFLHYLKPFKLRLSLAFFCMMLVAIFSAANIMMLIPALEVLMTEQGVATAPADAAPAMATDAASAIEEVAGGFLATPKAILNDLIAPLEAWYHEASRTEPFTVLIALAIALATMTAIKCCAEYLAQYQLAYSLYFVNTQMRQDIFANILRQDYLFFTNKTPGYLISRVTSDIRAIRSIIDKMITDGIQQPLNLTMMMIALLMISPQLTIVVFFLMPPIAGLLYYFSKKLRKNTKKQQKKTDEVSSTMGEAFQNIRLVKAFGTEEYEIEKLLRRNLELFRYAMARRMAKFGAGPIMEFLGTIAACGVLLLGGFMILGTPPEWLGTLTTAEFTAYLIALSRFYRPMKSLSNMAMTYQVASVSAGRIKEMMELEPTIIETADPKPFESLKTGIELRDVTVQFKDKKILDGVNLSIPRGKKIALVGESGAGKTSIANLIARLFDTKSGQVLVDGIDLREYRISDLRRKMGIVSQDTILFDDTVENNITYGMTQDDMLAPEVRQQKIRQAAMHAHAHEFIQTLDDDKAYQTEVGSAGGRLSGGQAQRIALARAFYRDPEILILDEATSALDTHAQALVQSAITELLEHRTAIIIAHRLSTVRTADYIYVLDQGRVVEEGTHDELLAKQGAYYRLHLSEERKQDRPNAPVVAEV